VACQLAGRIEKEKYSTRSEHPGKPGQGSIWEVVQ
jgi:hypothetical protein